MEERRRKTMKIRNSASLEWAMYTSVVPLIIMLSAGPGIA